VSAPIRLDVDGPYGDTSFASRLATAASRVSVPDSYGEGEIVRECEAALARALGKERAVLFPTGTLANVVALDRLCPRHARRVLLHPESHILSDTGDSLAANAGIMPVVAVSDGAGFGRDALTAALAASRAGKVRQGIGAVVIETPVRRRHGEMFPRAELDDVVAGAKSAGVALHLDGARLPIAAAARGVSMAQFAAPFDTVYLSLWKMLGLPFGAALAGPASTLDGVEHDRRRLGGALPQFWPIACVTLAELPRLETDWTASLRWKIEFERALATDGSISTAPVGAETANTLWLIPGGDVVAYKAGCKEAGIVLGEAVGDRVLVRANPTIVGVEPGALARRLAASKARA
jgi:threonine aldolase